MTEDTSLAFVQVESNDVLYRLRQDLRVFPPREGMGDRRYTIYDPKTDLSYFFGKAELEVAQMFDGQSSLEAIAARISQNQNKILSPSKLTVYEQRLRKLGLLEDSSGKTGRCALDPAVGISYGPLKKLLMIPVLNMDPTAMFDLLYKRCRWLCSVGFIALGFMAIGLALSLVLNTREFFWQDVKRIYGGTASWLLWHYPIIVLSIFVHEIGHGLSCRHYNVRITHLGIAVYFLLSTGWARPLQGDWSALNKRQRMISIAMGPYASLLFAALGVFLWQLSVALGQGTEGLLFWRTLGLVMAVSSTVALIPTLLPMFNGDTYLAITELIGLPRLRQRAFLYVKNLVRRRPQDEPLTVRRKVLYIGTVTGTIAGWIVAWFLLIQLIQSIYQWVRG